jgi:hypothetical protein
LASAPFASRGCTERNAKKNPSWIVAGMGYKALPTGYDLTQNDPRIAAQRLEHLT